VSGDEGMEERDGGDSADGGQIFSGEATHCPRKWRIYCSDLLWNSKNMKSLFPIATRRTKSE